MTCWLSDFLPTLAELTGGVLPADIKLDGHSFAALLRRRSPTAVGLCRKPKQILCQNQDRKLYSTGNFYNTQADPFEKSPLDTSLSPEATSDWNLLRQAVKELWTNNTIIPQLSSEQKVWLRLFWVCDWFGASATFWNTVFRKIYLSPSGMHSWAVTKGINHVRWLFWILLRPLIFFQTQWLSFFAGILLGYFKKIWWDISHTTLGITALLCLQLACNGILISRMHCGQIFNAGLQATGGVSLFAIAAMMSRILLQAYSLKRLTVLSILNGIVLFGWQMVMIMEYLSEEDFRSF